jgi:hypothetical protein
VEAAKVNGSTAGGAAVVDCITAGGVVEVNCGAIGRQQGVGSNGSLVRSLITGLVRNSRRISAISWLMYRMHIGTIIVYIGSSTVPAIGSFGWQCSGSIGSVP